MATGDIYQLIAHQELAGQEVLNVYFYRQDSLVAGQDAEDLAEQWELQILPAIAATQSLRVLYTAIEVNNLFTPSDRTVRSISEPGTAPNAEYHSNFDAVGWSLVQDNGAVKNGAKRIAGLPEAYSADGVIDNATYIALLTTAAAALTGSIDAGVIATWFPVIVKRILESPGVYRLPENSGEAVFGGITDAVFNPLVTSQVSRKIGVGV